MPSCLTSVHGEHAGDCLFARTPLEHSATRLVLLVPAAVPTLHNASATFALNWRSVRILVVLGVCTRVRRYRSQALTSHVKDMEK